MKTTERITLLGDDVAADDLRAFVAVAANYEGAPLERVALDCAAWADLQDWRRGLREMRGELSEAKRLTDDQQAALKVAALSLQAINAELDARSEAGSREPRRTAGRKTPADSGEPVARQLPGGQAHIASRRMGDIYTPTAGGAGGFSSLGAFALAAVRDPTDPRLRAATTTFQREGVGADGGFAVAPAWVDALLDQALEQEAIRPRANVIPVNSNPCVFPAFDLSSQVGAKRAGVELKWMGEGASGTDQAAKLRDVTLPMHKGAIFISLSSEIFEDMPNAERRIQNIMAAAVASGLDYAFVGGSGVGQPTGILNSPALVTQTKESGQSAATLLLANLAKMVGRLHPRSFRNATWLLHPTCVPALVQMSVTIKNVAGTENVGGSFVPAVVWGPDGSLTIFGRPAVVTDACSPLGTVGDCLLCDLSRYLVAVRREATLQTSIHAGWSQDLLAMRLILRLNATSEDNAPTTLRDGSNTVSPFVALEAR